MARFLLIHGAAHGAWAWRDTIPALEALGHEARAIDLPSHGADKTPLAEVTLDRYAEAILEALDGPTILVGHSMGGYPITRAADMDPANITRLVYLCAYVPWPGLSLADMRKKAPYQPLIEAIRRHDDGISMSFDPGMAKDKFYHDCTDDAFAFAMENLCAQALAPQQTAFVPGPHLKDLPRSYIICARDGAIPPEFQRTMAGDFAPGDVHVLNTSHSPFLSAPALLAGTLDTIAGQD